LLFNSHKTIEVEELKKEDEEDEGRIASTRKPLQRKSNKVVSMFKSGDKFKNAVKLVTQK